ncbi:WD40-repeat-containing domain protein [Spinellus fusiger]|nr:WD40-repeat-containing domain protein [Spinellus fusiger]
MPADIPGYYFNEEKNRYFKIMPTGPHSLSAIKQAREEKEREAAIQQGMEKQKQETMNMSQFLRWRQTGSGGHSSAILREKGQRVLFKQITLDTRIQLPLQTTASNTSTVCMDLTSSQGTGEILCSFENAGILRYGYQVNPFFHMWGNERYDKALSIASMQYASPIRRGNGTDRTIVGTFYGEIGDVSSSLWRLPIHDLPPLSQEDTTKLSECAPEDITTSASTAAYKSGRVCRTVSAPHDRDTAPALHYGFEEETLWASAAEDTYDSVVAGGNSGIYAFNSELQPIQRMHVKSSIFVLKSSKAQPRQYWYGSRNGTVGLYDIRCNEGHQPHPLFNQLSSITYLYPLEDHSSGHTVLVVGTNGLINIWDARFPYTPQKKKKKTYHTPVKTLEGHQNAYTRELGVDYDPNTNLLVAAGDDKRLRLWSLINPDSNEPFWTSEKSLTGIIKAAKFVTDPPALQSVWNTIALVEKPLFDRRCPGLLVCAPFDGETPAIEWMSVSR